MKAATWRALSASVLGGVLLLAPAAQAAPPEAQPDQPQALAKARVEAARKTYEAAVQGLQQTRRVGNVLMQLGRPADVYDWSVRWLNAERDLGGKKDDQLAALAGHLQRMKELEKRVAKLSEVVPSLDVSAAEYYRVEAEFWLAREKAKK
jgi:hypothetical protein